MAAVLKHFKLSEFDCKCCGKNWIDLSFVRKLDQMREEYGSAIYINSGYRCPKHNQEVGGVRNSEHVQGIAADISGIDMDRLYVLACKTFLAVGDGRNKGLIHVDMREEKHRWDYRPSGK